MVKNNQESRHKYKATYLSIRSFARTQSNGRMAVFYTFLDRSEGETYSN